MIRLNNSNLPKTRLRWNERKPKLQAKKKLMKTSREYSWLFWCLSSRNWKVPAIVTGALSEGLRYGSLCLLELFYAKTNKEHRSASTKVIAWSVQRNITLFYSEWKLKSGAEKSEAEIKGYSSQPVQLFSEADEPPQMLVVLCVLRFVYLLSLGLHVHVHGISQGFET